MFNAEEIVELEKKWFRYKVKQKSKLYIILTSLIIIITLISYQFYKTKNLDTNIVTNNIKIKENFKVAKKKNPPKIKEYKEINSTITKIDKKEKKIIKVTKQSIDTNFTKEKIDTKKMLVKDNKSYYFKLEPTIQGNELFSSNGFLNYNSPIQRKENKSTQKVIPPIKQVKKIMSNKDTINKNSSISINIKEMDRTTYLKEKFYKTSSIVFALMLSEEYYYDSKYNKALEWSLIANEIDPQNTRTWYWFAKSKVKLNQKDDAIKALKAYLSNNKSKRLNTLLHKIELGDTDD